MPIQKDVVFELYSVEGWRHAVPINYTNHEGIQGSRGICEICEVTIVVGMLCSVSLLVDPFEFVRRTRWDLQDCSVG